MSESERERASATRRPVTALGARASRLQSRRRRRRWPLPGEASFKARNLPNDNLDLAVPIWTTDVHWVPQQPSQLLTSTGFVQFRLRGEVCLYDQPEA